MSVVIPKAGDIFRCIAKKRQFFFQILAEYDFHSEYIVRTAPIDQIIGSSDPQSILCDTYNADYYAYSFLRLSNPFEFHKNFEFVASILDFSNYLPYRPTYILRPFWRVFSYNYIPPEWTISEIEYIGNYARAKSHFSGRLGRVPLPDQFHCSLFCKHYTHGQYLLGLQHPYDISSPSPGVFSIKGQVERWTNETIKLWNDLYEHRYTSLDHISSGYSLIDNECRRHIFSKKGNISARRRLGKARSYEADEINPNSVRRKTLSLACLREDVSLISIHLRDCKVFKREQIRIVRNILNDFLNTISGKKKNEELFRYALHLTISKLKDFNERYNGAFIGEVESKMLVDFFFRATQYIRIEASETMIKKECVWRSQ